MKDNSSNKTYLVTAGIVGLILVVLFAIRGGHATGAEPAPVEPARNKSAEKIEFHDLESQMREFMGYNSTIALTAEQEAIKEDVLGSQPAVCCRNSSALTCCCPCNLSKSLWGLANYLIAEKGMKGPELKATLNEWIAFTNPSGYTGDSCYTGGCERSPRENGCGGMNDRRIVV